MKKLIIPLLAILLLVSCGDSEVTNSHALPIVYPEIPNLDAKMLGTTNMITDNSYKSFSYNVTLITVNRDTFLIVDGPGYGGPSVTKISK